MDQSTCATCGGTGTVLEVGSEWCDQYGRIHQEPVLEPCPECSEAIEEIEALEEGI